MRTLPSGTVTFLLTDVVGSTRLWDTVPRLMPEALALHDQVIRTAVESHGGVVLKARGEGDSVFAVFRRATDAANAAVAAQHALRSLDWSERCVLSVRMAIHTGEALERDGDYYGATVNRAARLRALAGGGQIVVSHPAADVIVDHLDADLRLVELGPQQLRDLERPETVYLLVDADAAPAIAAGEPSPQVSKVHRPPLPSALSGSGPFVGREEELERLIGIWERVYQGAPRVVMLGGEPGVGKTRLAAELARRAHEAGAVVLYGRCDEDLGAPYQPFAEALRQLLPSLDAGALRAVRGVEELARLVPEVTDIVPGLPAPTHSDPDTERYALFDTVARLFVAVSTDRPVLVVLDDLHWAAKPTLLMLRHVLRFGEGGHVQLLGTYRTTDLDPNHPLSGALADLHRDGIVERVWLAGLDERDVSALLEATGHDDDELARTLSTVTSGNPFFLIEVLRHVEETGGRWDPNTLPQGVREAVGRRLSRLTDPTRDALLAGAVAGARFSLELVETVLERDLVDAVEEASAAGILVEEPGGHLRFNHALVRQSLLTGVASVKRLRLHQRIAETLEATSEDSDEHLADLAYHYFESAWAGNAAKAVEYCRRAADQAMARLAYEGAAELYERAVQALDVHEVGGRDSDRADLLLSRCEAHLAAGDAAGAAAAVADLEAAAGGSRALGAWVVCFQGQLAVLTHPDQLDEMEHRVASAAEEFATLGDAAGEAVAHNTRASCLARLGRFAACELALDRALTAARQSTDSAAADHRRVNAVLASAPSAALWGPNPVARAGGRCLDVIRLLRITTGSPAVEATSIRCQAMLEAFRGREQAARRMLESTRRTLAELGLRHALLELDLYEGMVDLLADDAQTAAAHLRRAYDGFSRMGLDADAAEAAALLARACLALGDDDDAEHLCVDSERLGGQDLRASIAWRTVRAELLARRGEHQRARDFAEAAVALAEPTDALVDQGDAYLSLSVVFDAAGDHDAAIGAANEAVARYERKGASALAERARQFVGTATIASAGAEHAEEAPVWLPAGVFIAHFRRYNEIFAARAWAALGDVVHPDVSFENRRRLTLQLSSSGIEAYADFLRSVADDMGYGAVRNRYVAARGRRLVLARSTVVGHNDAPDAPTEELWNVLELSEDDRLAATVVFDVEDLDAAYAELDARYLAGDGAEHADVFRAIAEVLDAYNRRDPASAPMDATVEAIDHRPASVVAVGGAPLWSDFEGTIAQVPDSTLRVAAVHALEGDGAVVTTVHQGSTTDGVAVERIFHSVHLVENGRITRVELYPETELDAAGARFRQLRNDVSASFVPENVASTLISQMYRAAERRDWSALGALVADDFLNDDRRWRMATRGRAGLLESLRASFDRVGVQRLESTTLATRGKHLALTRLRVGDPDESDGAPEVEVLLVVAAHPDGQLAETVTFETDEIDAAVTELNARYLAGEGAPYEATVAPVLEATEVRIRDWGRWVELHAPDVEFVDHRPAALGVVKGRDAVAEALAPNPGEQNMAVAVEMVDHGVVFTRGNSTGTSADGLEAQWRVHLVWRVIGGLVIRLDVFEPEDLAAARAMFEELRRLSDASPPEENAAARAHRETYACVLEQRWADLEQLIADDVVFEDRRPILRLATRGRREYIEMCRVAVAAGFHRGDTEVVATRGDRLVLTRVMGTTDDSEHGAPENVTLWVTELDGAGRVIAVIGFDVNGFDAAVDELNARYLAGEGAPFAETLAPVLAAPGLRSNEWGRWVQLLADDVSFVDRRPASFGVVEGRDPVVQTFGQWNERGYTVRVEAVGDGVVLALNRVAGMSADGMEVEWLLLLLYVVEHGRLKRFELFAADDPRAGEAFDQFRGRAGAPPIADNPAATALSQYHDACARRDWDAVEALLADDVVSHERRSGAHIQWEGAAALIEVMRSVVDVWVQRFETTTIATRGSRLALVEVRGTGNDPQAGAPESAVLDVVELDAQGRITAIVVLDDDDLDAAVTELNARYLAGEGAPYAETLAPALECIEAYVGARDRWIELVAHDLVMVDHRTVGFGTIEGRDAFVRFMHQSSVVEQRVVAVDAVAEGVVSLHVAWTGESPDGAGVEWVMRLLMAVDGGVATRFELFDFDDLHSALARVEELRRAEPSLVAGNLATDAMTRVFAAALRRDWAAAEAVYAPDAVGPDRRTGIRIGTEGSRAAVAEIRFGVEHGVTRFDATPLATRGDRLVLARLRCGSDRAGAWVVDLLFIVETDTEGRITMTVGFDVDDIDVAFAELDRRYLEGEGAPYADTMAAVLSRTDAVARDNELWETIVTDDVRLVDHRRAAFGIVDGRDSFLALMREPLSLRNRVLTIERVAHGAALVLVNTSGRSPGGADVEWLMYDLALTQDGVVSRMDIFDPDDLDHALAVFDELRPRPPSPAVADNLAARSLAQFLHACLSNEWSAADDIVSERMVAENRRRGLGVGIDGRDEWYYAFRFGIERGVTRYKPTTLATRGDQLLLTHLWCGSNAGPDAPLVEFAFIVEVDAAGRITSTVAFDLDDLDSAFAELDRRYLAGQGEPYADSVRVLAGVLELGSHRGRDWDRVTSLLADDVTFIDHRLASLGEVQGRADVVDALRAVALDRLRIVAVEQASEVAVLALVSASGSSLDGEVVLVLCTVEGGRVTRYEFFADEDRDSAVASFERVRLAQTDVENGAARVQRRAYALVFEERWAELDDLLDRHVVMEDRRAGIRFSAQGSARFLEVARAVTDVGFLTGKMRVLATRGDRLVLSRMSAATPSSEPGWPAGAALWLSELSPAGKVAATIGFDPHDLDAASAELDARYLSGEAAPFADTWAAVVDAYRRFNDGRSRHWRGGTVDVNAFAHVPGVRARVTTVHRLTEGAALVAATGSVPGLESWEWLVVFDVPSGQVRQIETYPADEMEAALARFEELAGSR